MPLSGKVSFAVTPIETKAGGFASAEYRPQFLLEWLITSGIGLNQADLLYVTGANGLTLAQSASADLDVNASLSGIYGAAFTLVKIKALAVINRITSPGNLTVGRGATNGVPWVSAVSAGVVIGPGGGFLWINPSLAAIGVTAATGDLINVASAATVGTYTYDVAVIGASA